MSAEDPEKWLAEAVAEIRLKEIKNIEVLCNPLHGFPIFGLFEEALAEDLMVKETDDRQKPSMSKDTP